MIDEERFGSLLVKHEDGALNPDEMRELEGLLAEDTAAGRLLVEHYLFTSEMESVLGGQDGRAAHLAAVAAPVPARSRWPRRGLTAMLAATGAVAVLLGARSLWLEPGEAKIPQPAPSSAYATVREHRGESRISGGAGQRAAAEGASIGPGEAIELLPGAVVALQTQDASRFELALGARFSVGEAPVRSEDSVAARVLRLDRGTLRASVTRQPMGTFLVFVTPHARATILGTELSIVVEDTLTRVSVAHGQVLFEGIHDGSRLMLGAGQVGTGHEPARHADAAALAAVRALRDATPSPAVSWDFEDGVLPAGFLHGEINAGPPRAGNRSVVIGGIHAWAGDKFAVGLESRTTLVRYSEAARISFDYWLPAEGSKVIVQIRDRDQMQNYKLVLPTVTREAWTYAEVRLADFEPNVDRTKQLEPGDRVDHLYIMGGRVGGGPFYVDNIKVWGER